MDLNEDLQKQMDELDDELQFKTKFSWKPLAAGGLIAGVMVVLGGLE